MQHCNILCVTFYDIAISHENADRTHRFFASLFEYWFQTAKTNIAMQTFQEVLSKWLFMTFFFKLLFNHFLYCFSFLIFWWRGGGLLIFGWN